ncbi:MAG TPA: sporulation protein YabP [Firmicutes bacterium]|nr:sporulation protein YabP [Bacillota bacterium]
MEDRYGQKPQSYKHHVSINDREDLKVSGVVHVDSFDEEEVVLVTELGLLAVRGENLDIKQLDLEQGELCIEGLILELVYAEDRGRRHKGKSIMERLFK